MLSNSFQNTMPGSDKLCQARVLSSKARAPYMVLMEATLSHVDCHCSYSLYDACLVPLAQVEDKPLAEETTARRGSGKCVGLVYVKCSPRGTYWLPSVQSVGFLFYMGSTMLLRGSEICCLEIMKPLHFKVTSNDQSGLQ